MIAIGRAMLALDLQNTHCGNISVREGEDFYITKTGSMKGHLEPRDIVQPGLEEPETGLFQSSSETGTHRKILQYAGAATHAHSMSATLLSYIVDVLEPIDALSRAHLGPVPVTAFEYPVGSKEMEDEIPRVLESAPAMIVKTHGPFVRGNTLNEAFYNLCLVDYAAEILLQLHLLGLDIDKIPMLDYPDIGQYIDPDCIKETGDEILIKQFRRTFSDLFTLKLSPFHSGSLSVEDGNEMLYAPAASTPDYMENGILRLPLKSDEENYFRDIHRAVYQYSNARSAIFTHSPWAQVQAFKAVVEGIDRIIPVDAEGGYLYPAIPVIMPDTDMKSIIEKAERYKMVVLAGLGVLSIGHTPGHTIHHCSSLKNICYLKTQLEHMVRARLVDDSGKFLDERGKSW